MGGGREIPICTSTPAIVGTGTILANARRIVPKTSLFILLPPLLLVPVTTAVTLIMAIMPSAFSSPISSFSRDKNRETAAAGGQQDRDDDDPPDPLHMTLPARYLVPISRPS